MNNRLNRVILIAALGLSSQILAGCLQTRESTREIEEKQVLRSQVATVQRSTADLNSRFQDIEDELRRLNGRIETVENRMSQNNSRIDKADQNLDAKIKENGDKMAAYREELIRLNTEVEQLKSQLAAMGEAQKREADSRAAQAAAAAQAAKKDKGPFASAEDNFESKKWKEAILDYEKYRKSYPKGKFFGAATYKIGVSFQELGMIDEAKAFYEEVIAKFPKSKEAGRASAKLKSLKK